MPPSKPIVTIVERDGDVVEIVASGASTVTAIAEMELTGDTLTLRGMHVDGAGRGSSSLGELREMVRELGRQQGAKEVVILGGMRTTGANPGKLPRPIKIRIE
ncbi:MAG TPA: hypothetical protein VNH11_28730 [Pirellulales bacterium]|nr:hypothetical protein [Pirellulales bacterium]